MASSASATCGDTGDDDDGGGDDLADAVKLSLLPEAKHTQFLLRKARDEVEQLHSSLVGKLDGNVSPLTAARRLVWKLEAQLLREGHHDSGGGGCEGGGGDVGEGEGGGGRDGGGEDGMTVALLQATPNTVKVTGKRKAVRGSNAGYAIELDLGGTSRSKLAHTLTLCISRANDRLRCCP